MCDCSPSSEIFISSKQDLLLLSHTPGMVGDGLEV